VSVVIYSAKLAVFMIIKKIMKYQDSYAANIYQDLQIIPPQQNVATAVVIRCNVCLVKGKQMRWNTAYVLLSL
jgi:hypothetical protein